MKDKQHIIIKEGADAGRSLSVPDGGLRIGRSSKNDISLPDPMLSRYHCRVFFKDDGLWIADLGSANETLVNDVEIEEAPLHNGDTITIGDTIMKVTDDGRPHPHGTVDLGLGSSGSETIRQRRRKLGIGPLLTVLFVVVIFAAGAFILKNESKTPKKNPKIATAEAPDKKRMLTVDYEKVEATPENIFYYHLKITPPRTLSISIDDLQNNRSVREEKKVDESQIRRLSDFLEHSGFFEQRTAYEGVSADRMARRTISITIGNITKTVKVLNRAEPDIFAAVREKLEDFGKVELGIWAIQFSTEKLISLSDEAYRLGKKLYAERMVSLGNLSLAIKSFKEAEWYLDTVEDKPDFYDDILVSRRQCTEELKKLYKEHSFATERAIKLRDWPTAATELRTIQELIPDRSDPRNKDARKKLIEVDARLGTRR